VEFRVLHGPNVFVPFPAVLAEVSGADATLLGGPRLDGILADILPAVLVGSVAVPSGEISFADLAAVLARMLLDLHGPSQLRVDVQAGTAGSRRVLIETLDPQAGLAVLRASVEVAGIVFAHTHGTPERRQHVATLLQTVEGVLRFRQPDYIARALMRAARRRGIPFYPVSPTSRIWLYGQGSLGSHLFEAASERDSLTGMRLTQNKFLSNQLVTRLGLPGVAHGIARDAASAARIAAELGFPVVVKPIDRGRGIGVRANITSNDELKAAFTTAQAQSERGVLVERHVAGEDHRLAVFGGRFAWAVRRSPPRVKGDGRRSVTELIRQENENRSDADIAAGFVARLAIDADMRSVLAKQGLRPEDRPEAGRVVQLRTIANTATGATVTDCTASIHPDNRALAEAIARGFRMDAVGIDFMTPDITRSWREVACGVLEVNPTPGFSSDGRADIILRESFPDGADGRIPSVVLVGAPRSLVDRVAVWLESGGRCAGCTGAVETVLAGQRRCEDRRGLHARVQALVLDPGCEALVIDASPDDVESLGFPLDRCSVALIAEGVALGEPLRRLIDDCAAQIVEDVNEGNFDQRAAPLLTAAIPALRPGASR